MPATGTEAPPGEAARCLLTARTAGQQRSPRGRSAAEGRGSAPCGAGQLCEDPDGAPPSLHEAPPPPQCRSPAPSPQLRGGPAALSPPPAPFFPHSPTLIHSPPTAAFLPEKWPPQVAPPRRCHTERGRRLLLLLLLPLPPLFPPPGAASGALTRKEEGSSPKSARGALGQPRSG